MDIAQQLDPPLDIPPLPEHPTDWTRAWHCMRGLIAEPEKTERAVDVYYAAGRRAFERHFQRFLLLPECRRLLARRKPLIDFLGDRDLLARQPDGSLGREYLDYLDANGFEADGLLTVDQRVAERWEAEEGLPRLDPARHWFRERFQLSHDLFHVLTGYGTDHLGEATLLAFTWAQNSGGVQALLTWGAAVEVLRRYGRGWPSYVFRAWRRGRRARWLLAIPFEELLALPLETVRSLAEIEPASVCHPGGILCLDVER